MVDLLNTSKTLSTPIFSSFRALLRMPGLCNSSHSRNPVFRPLTLVDVRAGCAVKAAIFAAGCPGREANEMLPIYRW